MEFYNVFAELYGGFNIFWCRLFSTKTIMPIMDYLELPFFNCKGKLVIYKCIPFDHSLMLHYLHFYTKI